MDDAQPNLVPFTCPACYGVLAATGNKLYQCPVGHVYSLLELIEKEDQRIENLLWTLYRSMTERTTILTLLAEQEPTLSDSIKQQIADSEVLAYIVCGLLPGHR